MVPCPCPITALLQAMSCVYSVLHPKLIYIPSWPPTALYYAVLRSSTQSWTPCAGSPGLRASDVSLILASGAPVQCFVWSLVDSGTPYSYCMVTLVASGSVRLGHVFLQRLVLLARALTKVKIFPILIFFFPHSRARCDVLELTLGPSVAEKGTRRQSQ